MKSYDEFDGATLLTSIHFHMEREEENEKTRILAIYHEQKQVLRSMNATENFDFISKNYKSQTIIEDDYHVISSLSMEY